MRLFIRKPHMFSGRRREVSNMSCRAHKAAYPHKYPVKESARNLYPLLKDIDKRFPNPSSVHLQVYDGEYIIGSFRRL